MTNVIAARLQPPHAYARAVPYIRQISGELHLPQRLAEAMCELLPGFASGGLRGRLYRLLGADIGVGAFIMGKLELVGGSPEGFYKRLSIGADVVVGNHVTINLDAEVRLEQHVSIGPFVRIYTGTHPIGPGSNRRVGQVLGRPVLIGTGSWIGIGSMILPGVTIGRGCIIAAGSVVSCDIPPNSYAEGNPAKVLRELPWGNR